MAICRQLSGERAGDGHHQVSVWAARPASRGELCTAAPHPERCATSSLLIRSMAAGLKHDPLRAMPAMEEKCQKMIDDSGLYKYGLHSYGLHSYGL